MREKEHEMKSTMSKRRKKLVNRKINIVEMAESRLVASKMVFKPSGFLVHQMKCDAGRNAPRFCTPMSFFLVLDTENATSVKGASKSIIFDGMVK